MCDRLVATSSSGYTRRPSQLAKFRQSSKADCETQVGMFFSGDVARCLSPPVLYHAVPTLAALQQAWTLMQVPQHWTGHGYP